MVVLFVYSTGWLKLSIRSEIRSKRAVLARRSWRILCLLNKSPRFVSLSRFTHIAIFVFTHLVTVFLFFLPFFVFLSFFLSFLFLNSSFSSALVLNNGMVRVIIEGEEKCITSVPFLHKWTTRFIWSVRALPPSLSIYSFALTFALFFFNLF